MRLHLLGLPHTETTNAYSWCAYTAKTKKLATMLTSLGHEVFLYAGEANEASCTEHIPVVDKKWQKAFFGKYDWSKDVFNDWDEKKDHWRIFNARIVAAITERSRPGDYLGITAGLAQKPISNALPELTAVEVGIGYEGVYANHRVYESYAWAHHVSGLRIKNLAEHGDNVRFYDAVIPNSFEEEDFPLGAGTGDYYLFIGRLITRKGITIAAETCERTGAKLVVAGQGMKSYTPGKEILTTDGTPIRCDVEYVGVVGPGRRAELMGNAIATFVPTIYLEPFGGVAVEAMMTGCPVLTTDWGAFTETVQQGVTGFRCRTLAEFVAATMQARFLDRAAIREYAVARYATEHVRHQYDAYFQRLDTLKGEGWYDLGEVKPS